MNILYLCPDIGIPVLGRKGASVHVRGLINALDRAGHSVVLATPLLTKSPWEEPAEVAARLLHIPASANAMAAFRGALAFNDTLGVGNTLPGEMLRILYNQELATRLAHHLHSHPPDFIYERASLYATGGVALARKLDRPLLIELNSPLAMEQSAYRGTGLGELAAQAERWTLSQADAVVTVSAALRDYAISCGVDEGHAHVLPNGVDPRVFRPLPPDPEIRARWGLGTGLVLGFVGGLRPWHGVKVLPALLGRLVARERSLRLVIVGDGPLRGDVEEDMRAAGLLSRVVFTGSLRHEEVAPLISQFDVALAPYAQADHPFYFSPLKLFEYMACGKPAVAARLGQIDEVVRDGETGLLYPPGDLDALTAACHRLLADAPLRRRLGEAAAHEVRRSYTWDRNAERVASLAQGLMAGRRVEG